MTNEQFVSPPKPAADWIRKRIVRGWGAVVDKTYTTISEQQEQHCLLTLNEVMVRLLELSPKRQLPVLLLLVVAIAVVVVIFVVIFDFV